jgi:hypothetical protein
MSVGSSYLSTHFTLFACAKRHHAPKRLGGLRPIIPQQLLVENGSGVCGDNEDAGP